MPADFIDYFYFPANSNLVLTCKTCKTLCNVEKNRMISMKSHDFYYCPNVNENWHVEATNLYIEKEKTFSPSLKAIMEKDLQTMITQKGIQ